MRTLPDGFMLSQWEFMLEVVAKNNTLTRYKLPLLYLAAGKLEGYGLAHPKPGKLALSFHMAERIKDIAHKLEGTDGIF